MISALIIISNNNLALISDENISLFLNLYSTWANNLYVNIQVLTGEIIKLSWMPEN